MCTCMYPRIYNGVGVGVGGGGGGGGGGGVSYSTLSIIYILKNYPNELQRYNFYISLTCTVDNSPDVIKHLKIALGIVTGSLVLCLGPCACYCIYCCYKNYVHNCCKEKFKGVNTIKAIMCCKDYTPINEPIRNGQQNCQIN